MIASTVSSAALSVAIVVVACCFCAVESGNCGALVAGIAMAAAVVATGRIDTGSARLSPFALGFCAALAISDGTTAPALIAAAIAVAWLLACATLCTSSK